MNRRLVGRFSAAVLSAALVALVGGPVSASDSGNRSDLKNFQHVFVILDAPFRILRRSEPAVRSGAEGQI